MSIDNQAHKELLDASIAVAGSFDGVGSDCWMRGEVHSSDYLRLNKCISRIVASMVNQEPPEPSATKVIEKIVAKLIAEAEKSSKWAEDRLLRRIAEEIKEGKF